MDLWESTSKFIKNNNFNVKAPNKKELNLNNLKKQKNIFQILILNLLFILLQEQCLILIPKKNLISN